VRITRAAAGGGAARSEEDDNVSRFYALTRRFTRGPVSEDLGAGLVLGLESVPDGLAAGVLAGVNPLFGLYGYMFGTMAGALTTSSTFMVVQATGAMAIVVADIPQVRVGGPEGNAALFTVAVLTGGIMLALGLARVGPLVRFVPNAVMTGFVNAIALNIVLGQLDNFTGYASEGSNRLLRAIDTMLNVASYSWAAVLVGGMTILMIVLLERTRLGAIGIVVAITLTSVLAQLLGFAAVEILRDITDVPSALPTPVLPDLSLVGVLLIPALSLAFVGAVQGAAISSSIPNEDGSYPDVSGDFRGQGVASIVAGVFQGLPVAGSLSATGLMRTAGARTRLATVSASVVMVATVLLFADVVGYVATPGLAGLLMVVGGRSLKPDRVLMVWRTGLVQATVLVTTFVLTMIIPLQYAVLVGVGLSVVLYVVKQSNRITVRRRVFDQTARWPVEEDPPAEIPSREIVVLQPYGSLFFAAAPVFEAQLPDVSRRSNGSVVIIRLRGKEDVGSTFIAVVTRYSKLLREVGARLMLAGVSDRVYVQLRDTRAVSVLGDDNVFRARPSVGESMQRSMDAAQAWIDARTPKA
jgi:sulfate permease, SulP family